ncbi:MAG: phage holin family protein [Candidatus Dormibacteria bacterium]
MTQDPRFVAPQVARENVREQSIPDLMRQLAGETSTLVRQELELAKAEMTQKGKQAGVGVGLFGGSAIVALLALGALTACLIALLSLAMHVWVAALIVTVVYAVIAAGLASAGRTRLKQGLPATPEQTVDSVKEDLEWTKIQAQSGRR